MQGLGEMMPEQLWQTTLDPEHRMLRRLTLHDAAEAAHLFTLLMGAQVPPCAFPRLRLRSACCHAHCMIDEVIQ